MKIVFPNPLPISRGPHFEDEEENRTKITRIKINAKFFFIQIIEAQRFVKEDNVLIRERPPNVLIHGYNEATIRETIVEKKRCVFRFLSNASTRTVQKREDDDERKLVILAKRKSKFVQKTASFLQKRSFV